MSLPDTSLFKIILFNLSYTNTGGIAFIILLIQRNGGIVCRFLFVIFLCCKLLAVAGFTLYNAVTVIGVIVAFHNEIFATALAFTHSNYLTSQFPKFIQNHGCKRMRFHDLRHSCASLLPQTSSAPSLFEFLFLFCQSKKQALRPAFHFGGELGIRTLGTLRTQHFESSVKKRTWRNLTEDNGRCENPRKRRDFKAFLTRSYRKRSKNPSPKVSSDFAEF